MELSSTRLDCYLQCPLKFRFRYIDGIEPEEVAAYADKGTIVFSSNQTPKRKKVKTSV